MKKTDMDLYSDAFFSVAAWRVVDPILRDVTPMFEYEPNT
jgi:hypothetical protein